MCFRSAFIRPTFELQYPPNQTFTTQFSKVKGSVKIHFIQRLKSVFSIDVSIKGDALAIYRYVHIVGHRSKRITSDYFKNNTLFDNPTNLFFSNDSNGTHFNENNHLDFQFELIFPKPEVLPSSTDGFGEKRHLKGRIEIRYYLYLRVQYLSAGSSTNKLHYVDYKVPLKFEGGGDPKYGFMKDDPAHRCSESFLFPRKLKSLIPNEQGQLVSSDAEVAHTSSWFFRQVFDSKLKIIAKDVEFRITVDIPKIVRLDLDYSQFGVIFECPCLLKNKEQFIVNGESTKLGVFELEIIGIQLCQHRNIGSDKINCDNRIIIKPMASGEITKIDIAGFNYDENEMVFRWVTSFDQLMGSSNRILSKDLKSPILNNIKLGDFFLNYNVLCLDFKVNNTQTKERRHHFYRFHKRVVLNNEVRDSGLLKLMAAEGGERTVARFQQDDMNRDKFRNPALSGADENGRGVVVLQEPFHLDDGGDIGDYFDD